MSPDVNQQGSGWHSLLRSNTIPLQCQRYTTYKRIQDYRIRLVKLDLYIVWDVLKVANCVSQNLFRIPDKKERVSQHCRLCYPLHKYLNFTPTLWEKILKTLDQSFCGESIFVLGLRSCFHPLFQGLKITSKFRCPSFSSLRGYRYSTSRWQSCCILFLFNLLFFCCHFYSEVC